MRYSKEQLAIINSGSHRASVIAVAGAGKTTTMKAFIKKAMATGIKSSGIVACTFTRKMAKELKRANPRLEWCDTIHGICMRIVEENKGLAGYNRIILVDDIEDKEIIKNIISRNGIKITIKAAEESIERYCLTGNMSSGTAKENVFIVTYLRELRSRDAITFRLIEYYASKILGAIDGYYFDLVVVDEYQDITPLEEDIIFRLSSKGRLMAIGDPMQSIYGFRGADHTSLTRVGGDVFSSLKSYRLPSSVASLANSLMAISDISENVVIDHNGTTGKVDIITDTSTESVYNSLRGILDKYEPQDVYVLARTNRQVAYYTDALADLPIDTEMAAVKNMKYMSYLNIACRAYYNGYYKHDLIRLLRLFDYRDSQLLAMESSGKDMYGQVKDDTSIVNFIHIMKRNVDMMEKAKSLLPLFEKQRGEYDHFMVKILPYLKGIGSDLEFMEWYQEMSAADFMPEDKVAIITIHASKGMENKAILIPGVEDGKFPNHRASFQEELRLFYVAVTRAKEHLVIHQRDSSFLRGRNNTQ